MRSLTKYIVWKEKQERANANTKRGKEKELFFLKGRGQPRVTQTLGGKGRASQDPGGKKAIKIPPAKKRGRVGVANHESERGGGKVKAEPVP